MPETVAEPPQQTVTKPQRIIPPEIDPKTRELAKALFIQGKPYVEIEAETGVKQPTLRTWAKRNGWRVLVAMTKNTQTQAMEKRSVSVIIPTQSEQSARVRNVLGAVVERQAAALAASQPSLKDLGNTPERQGHAAVLKTLADAASTVFDWDSQHTPGIVLVGEVEQMIERSETPIEIESRVEQSPEASDTTTGGSAE